MRLFDGTLSDIAGERLYWGGIRRQAGGASESASVPQSELSALARGNASHYDQLNGGSGIALHSQLHADTPTRDFTSPAEASPGQMRSTEMVHIRRNILTQTGRKASTMVISNPTLQGGLARSTARSIVGNFRMTRFLCHTTRRPGTWTASTCLDPT